MGLLNFMPKRKPLKAYRDIGPLLSSEKISSAYRNGAAIPYLQRAMEKWEGRQPLLRDTGDPELWDFLIKNKYLSCFVVEKYELKGTAYEKVYENYYKNEYFFLTKDAAMLLEVDKALRGFSGRAGLGKFSFEKVRDMGEASFAKHPEEARQLMAQLDAALNIDGKKLLERRIALLNHHLLGKSAANLPPAHVLKSLGLLESRWKKKAPPRSAIRTADGLGGHATLIAGKIAPTREAFVQLETSRVLRKLSKKIGLAGYSQGDIKSIGERALGECAVDIAEALKKIRDIDEGSEREYSRVFR